MDPANKKENYSQLKKLLKYRGNIFDSFHYNLQQLGWSSLPPWADYQLLIEAIKFDRFREVEVLLEKGCRVMKPGCSTTPLHTVVKKGWWNFIERFLELGARVSDPTRYDGDTVVHLIDHSYEHLLHHYDVLFSRYLQETTVNVKNREGISFLHIACTRSDIEVVKKCLDNNPDDVNCQISMNEPSRNQRLKPGFTPLFCAIQYNREEIVKVLLEYSADLDILDVNCSTPMHIALEVALALGQQTTPILDILFSRYVIREECIDDNYRTLLMTACAAVDDVGVGVRFSEELLTEEVNDYDNDGNTALHFAARFGRYNFVDLLLQYGAECCRANNQGLTPLAMARQQGHENICNLIQESCTCNQPTA